MASRSSGTNRLRRRLCIPPIEQRAGLRYCPMRFRKNENGGQNVSETTAADFKLQDDSKRGEKENQPQGVRNDDGDRGRRRRAL